VNASKLRERERRERSRKKKKKKKKVLSFSFLFSFGALTFACVRSGGCAGREPSRTRLGRRGAAVRIRSTQQRASRTATQRRQRDDQAGPAQVAALCAR
jgi:hypothetical protein